MADGKMSEGASPSSFRLPPLSTRLLTSSARQADVTPTTSGDLPPPPPPYSALLLGSPGETTLDERNYVTKTTRDGARSGLQGVLRDLMLARAFLVNNRYSIYECLHGMRIWREEVLGALSLFFLQENQPQHFVVYFSGHGNPQTGNWVLTDGELSLHDLYQVFRECAPPGSSCSVVADSCHSGAWVDQLRARPGDFDSRRFAVQAACLKDEVCWDTRVGGLFTKSWVSGEYYRLAQQQVRSHRGQIKLDKMKTKVDHSLATYLPWAGFVSNNPGVLACRLFAATGLFACNRECSALGLPPDLEKAQNPISSHPFAWNLIFHDSRFAEMEESDRFPEKSVVDGLSFINLANFWLGKT